MIADGLKLDVYLGETLTADGRLAGEALMDCFEAHGVRAAALYRGIEGFGIGARIRTERIADISSDLPLIAEAIDTRETIEATLADVDAIVTQGLVTLEHSLLVVGDDVRRAEIPRGVGGGARMTVYCGRGERAGRRSSHRAVVDLMRRHGAGGATVLLGVDGLHHGRRRRAALLRRNPDVPTAVIAVGPPDVLQGVAAALPEVLAEPIANLERIAIVKHDGEQLEPLPTIADPEGEEPPPVWVAVRIYTRQSAQVDGGALYTALTRRLRDAGAAGVTTVRGEWGFSGDEVPFGDRFGTLRSHVPTYTVLVERPRTLARIWPVVDEITAEHGVVTAALVPAYRERARGVEQGRVELISREALIRLARTDDYGEPPEAGLR